MHTAQPITTSKTTIANVKRLSNAARSSADGERNLYFFLTSLRAEERVELLALYMLGHGGMRSFNIALASAKNHHPDHIGGMLAEKTNLTKCLNIGLKRHKRHS